MGAEPSCNFLMVGLLHREQWKNLPCSTEVGFSFYYILKIYAKKKKLLRWYDIILWCHLLCICQSSDYIIGLQPQPSNPNKSKKITQFKVQKHNVHCKVKWNTTFMASHRPTVIICEGMYAVFHSHFAPRILCVTS